MEKNKSVAIVGSGSWGTTAALCIADNIKRMEEFSETVKLWVFEEEIGGKKLSELINQDRVNLKYLPGVPLPSNIVALTDLDKAVKDASHIVFVIPCQFIEKLSNDLAGKIRSDAVGISLIKGLLENDGKPTLISSLLTSKLGCHMSVLSGANIAMEIACNKFSETTIGCSDPVLAKQWKMMFERPHFKVNVVERCQPLEFCGALKNCIALSAGFADGLSQGTNTKAAIMRLGLIEMIEFCRLYDVIECYDMFFESFGVADLIATCFGGRNRLVAQQFITTTKSFEELERELLHGQKLQGPETLLSVAKVIRANKKEIKFPLFLATHAVTFGEKPRNSFMKLFLDLMHKCSR